MRNRVLFAGLTLLTAIFLVNNVYATRIMENIDRGLVAVRTGNGVYIGWRMLGIDPDNIAFNIYRNSVKINSSPITSSTNYVDSAGSTSSTYEVASVLNGVEQSMSDPVSVWSSYCHDVPLQVPAGVTTPDGVICSYSPNDASVGDLDGDGQYEIILKWDPSNSKDNAQSGYTGNVYLDAYEIDGTLLWRIDLGINIRAGAHYTQFMVYDLDSDGRSELVCKTADGTTDGLGTVLGDPAADYRNSAGRILSGPEYLSIFDGTTGAFLDTVDYNPPRHPSALFPTGDQLDAIWGDSYGNRVDRFLACVAYLDGQEPSVVMCRGYYTRTVLAAWDFRDGQLTQRWVFDSADSGNSAYAGQGNHNLSVADVDSDGKDEIIYGSCTIDDDGSGLYSTGLGHGDALHVSDMDPGRPGLEVWMPHEGSAAGATLRDAATGEILIDHSNSGDVGRGVAAHIDSSYVGYQLWSYATGGVYTVDNINIGNYSAKMMGSVIWWDSDLQREFLSAADGDGRNPVLEKWNGNGSSRLISLYSVPTSYSTNSNNSTKANPCLTGDIIGDWREEMIFRSSDNTKLRIFTNTEQNNYRFYTLMHDPQYRLAIAWQNVGYNQPPHPSFYIGTGMATPPKPDIILFNADPDETDPPRPNPMSWSVRPYAGGVSSIAMRATSAYDQNGVEYYFACTYGEGHDSGWQSSDFYEDYGLTAGQTYAYTVTARDNSNNYNITFASVPASCSLALQPSVAQWDFEDGVSGAAFSSMPASGSMDLNDMYVIQGYDETYGPSFSPETPDGSQLSFYCNGSQDGYTTDATLNSWSPQEWTIEVSVRLDELDGWNTIIGRDGSSQEESESDFYLQNNGIDDKFRINFDTVGGQRWVLDSDFVPVSNQWYHLVLTSDGSTLTMYCDKLDGDGYQVVGVLDISSQTPTENALAQNGFNWTFGRGWYNGSFVDHIIGYLDNIRFSDSVLAPDKFLAAAIPPEPYQWIYGDFTGDRLVDMLDFSIFSNIVIRMDLSALGEFDLDNNNFVGLAELIEFVENWLKEE